MSSQMKQQESMEHIFLSVKSILILLKDSQKEFKEDFDKIRKSVKKLWDDNLDDPLEIDVIMDCIKATPIANYTDLYNHSKKLIRQLRYRKERIDDHDLTKDVMENWTNSLLKTLWEVRVYNYKVMNDSINKTFRLLENIKSMIGEEELEQDREKETEKKKFFKGSGKGLGDF